jgi:Mrp family chromosome partitioning ATPase
MVRLRTNVALSMAMRPVNDPTQLLLSPQTTLAFDQLQADFEPDVMMFDLPPMLVTDDARALLQNVDCALIVARAEQTKISQLDVCEREVGELTNVLGVVLNNCRHMDAEDQYYGDYS